MIGQWVYPPGGSPWGGVRSSAWVGETIQNLGVELGDAVCHDPESGIHMLEVFAGSKRDADDYSPRASALGYERTTIDVTWDLGDHGTVHHVSLWCMNGAAQSIGANPAGEFQVDRTYPDCIPGVATIGEGLFFGFQANASRLRLNDFIGAMWDAETGIGLVEYELHDLTNGSSAPLPQLSHFGLPPRSIYAYGLQLLHNHEYTVRATPRNGVHGLGISCDSSATLVDLTPPIAGIVYVVHSDKDAFVKEPWKIPLAAHYQQSVQVIRITTRHFADNESGIADNYVSVVRSDGWVLAPERKLTQGPLAAFPTRLFDGQSFIVHWRCVNHAEQSTVVSSNVITVDVTPPVIEYIRSHVLGSDAVVEFVGFTEGAILICYYPRLTTYY